MIPFFTNTFKYIHKVKMNFMKNKFRDIALQISKIDLVSIRFSLKVL